MAQDNLDAAQRFFEEAEQAFRELAEIPALGRARNFDNPRLAGMRCRSIPRFENYLIFYRPVDNGIEVIRVLHGARDLNEIFEA
ncbi:MAG: type II toxin-antitoxin system RelE/ParE family toxin [Planctomycetota bacterium]